MYHDANGSEILSCSIITTDANELIKPVYNRMPVILKPDNYSIWLDSQNQSSILNSLRPYAANDMEAYYVIKTINNSRNDFSELLEAA